MESNHKEIYIIQLLNDNSLMIYFDDDTHTYINSDTMKNIVKEYLNNELPFPDEEEC